MQPMRTMIARVVGTVTMVGGLILLPSQAAQAQQLTCNANLSISYVAGPTPATPGDTVRVRIRFSAGDIDQGTTFTLNRMRFDLDCNNPPVPGAVGCLDDGLIIAYGGDNTITTTCQVNAQDVTWSTGHAADGVANQVVFTPSDPIVIPANTTNFCEIQFDVSVLAVSDDTTPNRAEQVAGYDSAQTDGQCNNGIASSNAQSGAIQLCPDCDDGDACTTEVCNTTTAQCQTTSTVTCDDINACTTESCDTSTGQCQTTSTVTCDDVNACTTESCNTDSGQCQTTSTVVCNDANACTTEACNVGTGQCETSSTVTCDDLNACTTEACNIGTGQCQTSSTVTCDDTNACTTEACNVGTGQCQTSSTVTCDDTNACTTEACNTTSGQCQTSSTVTCDDTNACTTESCNTGSGQCQTTSTVTCNDTNACTTESCNTGSGQCQTTSTVTCDDTNGCTTEACNTSSGQCQTSSTVTCNDQNDCTDESCNTSSGQCETTGNVTCNDENSCTTEACNSTSGQCETSSTVTCDDSNACTTESCNTSSGQCQTSSTVTCDDPVCEECNTSSGVCGQRDPLPASCAPTGCRITAGGIIESDTGELTVDSNKPADIQKATFGGQVGAPCGCIGCFDFFDHIQGNWEHSRKVRRGSFLAKDYLSLVCGCDANDGTGLKFNGRLCGDRETGPEPRPAPANLACWTGVGAFNATNGRRTTPVGFRVEVEDRGEPGSGKNDDGTTDVYRIFIWIPTGNDKAAEAQQFAEDACCEKTSEQAIADAGTPDILDGGELIHGNIQIHPQIEAHIDECPPPDGNCLNVELP